jgi:dipeptidyl aminopeptidase/acylaminoacyl peptidase
MVHGGPWVRDRWQFDPIVAALALRGYAVLRINYRGSGGYGRTFEKAGVGEWGGKMQDDLTDATCWAVKQGLADPQRMVIMGGSYGGYAALWALERTPRLFSGAIDSDGPVDLPAFIGELQPYAKPFLPTINAFISTDPKAQWDRSPLAHINQIERPILAFQGANDPRVRVTQLEKFEKAMRVAGKDITTDYLANEGHGMYHEQNFFPYLTKIFSFLENSFRNYSKVSFDSSVCPN